MIKIYVKIPVGVTQNKGGGGYIDRQTTRYGITHYYINYKTDKPI